MACNIYCAAAVSSLFSTSCLTALSVSCNLPVILPSLMHCFASQAKLCCPIWQLNVAPQAVPQVKITCVILLCRPPASAACQNVNVLSYSTCYTKPCCVKHLHPLNTEGFNHSLVEVSFKSHCVVCSCSSQVVSLCTDCIGQCMVLQSPACQTLSPSSHFSLAFIQQVRTSLLPVNLSPVKHAVFQAAQLYCYKLLERCNMHAHYVQYCESIVSVLFTCYLSLLQARRLHQPWQVSAPARPGWKASTVNCLLLTEAIAWVALKQNCVSHAPSVWVMLDGH